MPTLLSFDPPASKGLDLFHQSMALYPMGNGHRGGPILSSREKEILLATADYFTKWVEVKQLAQIREAFVISNLVCGQKS